MTLGNEVRMSPQGSTSKSSKTLLDAADPIRLAVPHLIACDEHWVRDLTTVFAIDGEQARRLLARVRPCINATRGTLDLILAVRSPAATDSARRGRESAGRHWHPGLALHASAAH